MIWEILYLVWQLPTPNRLLSELHMGDLGCSNLGWKVLGDGKKKMSTCLPLLMAISSDVGETLGSSEVPLPSSDSPSDPIRGCSCTTPRIDRGVSFGKLSKHVHTVCNWYCSSYYAKKKHQKYPNAHSALVYSFTVASLSLRPLHLFVWSKWRVGAGWPQKRELKQHHSRLLHLLLYFYSMRSFWF